MPSLYRQYRPENFSQIIGQNHVKITLSNEASSGTLSHAYLFCGPRAVGKTTFARILAKSANCLQREEGQYEPCGECENCVAIKEGRNMDVVEIDAASNTGVDNVRENIISFAKLPPSQGRYKVFIIDEVHMLSISAWNALLKVLEEPPHYVIFILCTTEIHKVPLTIISRCERFDFRKISFADVVKKLSYIATQEKLDIDQAVLEAVARQADGHLRDAESILGQIMSLGEKHIALEQAELVISRSLHNEILQLISLLSAGDAAGAIKLVNSLSDSNLSMKEFLKEGTEILRKMLLGKLSAGLAELSNLAFGDNFETKLNDLSQEVEQEKLMLMARMFISLYADNRPSPLPQLPLELAILDFCRPSETITEVSVARPASPASPIAPPKPKASSMKKAMIETDNLEPSLEANYSLEEVGKRWPDVLAKAKQSNHSLMFVLQNCRPSEIAGGRLTLSFRYRFHNDRFKDPAIKKLVESFSSEVFDGHNIAIATEVREVDREEEAPVAEEAASAPKNMLNSLLHTLGGGEIIG